MFDAAESGDLTLVIAALENGADINWKNQNKVFKNLITYARGMYVCMFICMYVCMSVCVCDSFIGFIIF